MPRTLRSLLAALLLSTALAGGGGPAPSPSVISPGAPNLNGPTLKGSAPPGLRVGAAVSAALFEDPAYAALVAREFSSVTPENAMKWQATEANEGTFVYGLADAIVSWATRHGIAVRGHTLIWHDSAPGWLYQIRDAARMRQVMSAHIRALMTHYPQVTTWDVVNEAVSDAPGHPLRANSPFAVAGPEYIAHAFREAHAANPQARLYYNDYSADGMNGKSDAIYALIRDLLAQGVPIHGVGFQAHLDETYDVTASRVTENLRRFRALGLDVQLTEVDVTLRGPPTPDALKRQARVYHDLLTACRAAGCSNFTLWGVTDLSSWRAAAYPLPFDDDGRPKPAHAALIAALRGPP